MEHEVVDLRPTLTGAARRTGADGLLNRLVPADLPAELAVARLRGLVRSLLAENVQLHDELLRSRGGRRALQPARATHSDRTSEEDPEAA